MSDDPTLRPRLPERAVIVGATLYRKRRDLGWQRKYAAARLGLSESELARYEQGAPIMESQFRRITRVYSRNFARMTAGMARQTKPGRFQ